MVILWQNEDHAVGSVCMWVIP
jgi:hypothetical protein